MCSILSLALEMLCGQVTVGEDHADILTITAEPVVEGAAITYELSAGAPAGVTLAGNVLSWSSVAQSSQQIVITVTETDGSSVKIRPQIAYCSCQNGGTGADLEILRICS